MQQTPDVHIHRKPSPLEQLFVQVLTLAFAVLILCISLAIAGMLWYDLQGKPPIDGLAGGLKVGTLAGCVIAGAWVFQLIPWLGIITLKAILFVPWMVGRALEHTPMPAVAVLPPPDRARLQWRTRNGKGAYMPVAVDEDPEPVMVDEAITDTVMNADVIELIGRIEAGMSISKRTMMGLGWDWVRWKVATDSLVALHVLSADKKQVLDTSHVKIGIVQE